MEADQVKFEFQVHAECLKKRKQIVQQIEIKMVDDFQDKRVSDFMFRGIDNETDPLQAAFAHGADANRAPSTANEDDATSQATGQDKSSSAGNTLRKMSQ